MNKIYTKPLFTSSASEGLEDVFAACCGPDCCGPIYNNSGKQTGWKACDDPKCDQSPFCGSNSK